MEYIDAEVVRTPPRVRAVRARQAGLRGCNGCPMAMQGLGDASGSYSYTAPGGSVVSITWPSGAPGNWQDQIVAWVQQNPMLALFFAFGAGLFAAKKV